MMKKNLIYGRHEVDERVLRLSYLERQDKYNQQHQRRRHERNLYGSMIITMIVIQLMMVLVAVDGFNNPSIASHKQRVAFSRGKTYNLQDHRRLHLASSNNDNLADEQQDESSNLSSFELLLDDNKDTEGGNVVLGGGSQPQFGEVVPLSKAPSNNNAQFGDVVRMPSSSSSPSGSSTKSDDTLFTATTGTTTLTTDGSNVSDTNAANTVGATRSNNNNRNIIVAITSITLAILNYFYQFTHPLSPVQLLFTLQQESDPITIVGKNDKPTIVDFWAPWCENCKQMAPTMELLHREYGNSMNFVMINADQRDAWPYIERFGVDAIPHMALISNDGDVETAMIGLLPKSYLDADINVLLKNAAATASASDDAPAITTSTLCTAATIPSADDGQEVTTSSSSSSAVASTSSLQASDTTTVCPPYEVVTNTNNKNTPHEPLPYQMLDVFERHPELRRVSFSSSKDT